MAVVLRVAGQVLGACLLAIHLIFLVGERSGGPGLTQVSLPLYICLAELLLGLFKPLPGGVAALVGIAGFYVMNYRAVGSLPGGPVFPLFWLAGALLVLGPVLRRRHA